ncbi:hypothetical protein B0H13DRAFT_2037166 [Mycena leptocephala]|nr:hypothetical protein B0H13DRAFT_2037166 [Mycena leptocephala]
MRRTPGIPALATQGALRASSIVPSVEGCAVPRHSTPRLSRSSTHAAAGRRRHSTGDRWVGDSASSRGAGSGIPCSTLSPGGGRRKPQAEGRRACIGDNAKTESGGEGYVGRGATKRGLGWKADSGGTYMRIRREQQGTMCCDAGKRSGDKNSRRG